MDEKSYLNDPQFTTLLFASLVKRSGGNVLISQSDIDEVAYCLLVEEGRSDGTIEFRLIGRAHAS